MCPDLCSALSVCVVRFPICVMHWVFVLYMTWSVSCIECLCCTWPDLCHALSVCVVRFPICVMHWVFMLYVFRSVSCIVLCRALSVLANVQANCRDWSGDTDQPSVLLSSALLHTAVQTQMSIVYHSLLHSAVQKRKCLSFITPCYTLLYKHKCLSFITPCYTLLYKQMSIVCHSLRQTGPSRPIHWRLLWAE